VKANLVRSMLVSFASLLLVLTAAPLRAHHSFEAEYDSRRPITLTGVVTKVDWINPHAYVFLDAKGEDGTVKNYRVEMGPPYALDRGGGGGRCGVVAAAGRGERAMDDGGGVVSGAFMLCSVDRMVNCSLHCAASPPASSSGGHH